MGLVRASMEIVINNTLCSSIDDVESLIGGEVACFLSEWFDNCDYVIAHTSGSTGTPKEIRLYKDDMRASAHITNRFFSIDSTSSLLLCLSPTYIAGKMMIVRAIEAGARLYVEPPTSQPLVHAVVPIDFAAMVPMQVHTLLLSDCGRERLASIRQLIIGGAVVSPDMERKLADISTNCYATYGMTETVSHVALRRLGVDFPGFTALDDVSFSVDKRDCLVIHTPQFHCKSYVTNDVVSLCDDKRFIWLGRYDHVINSGGVKIHPEQLERELVYLLSERYFITSLPDERLGERLVLVIESIPWPSEKIDYLYTQIRSTLSNPYHCPREIRFMPHFFETSSGKILRRLI